MGAFPHVNLVVSSPDPTPEGDRKSARGCTRLEVAPLGLERGRRGGGPRTLRVQSQEKRKIPKILRAREVRGKVGLAGA